MLRVLLSIVSAAFKKLPRGERRCGEKGGNQNPSELRAKWSHNSGSGWPDTARRIPSTWSKHTSRNCIVWDREKNECRAPWDLSKAASFISAKPPLDAPAAPARFSRALYAAATTTIASPTTRVYVWSRATVLVCSWWRRKEGTRAEKWHDERAERSRKSFYKERRCQTRRHLIMESRRVFFSELAWRSLGYPYFFVSLLQHVMFSILISYTRIILSISFRRAYIF